MSVTTKLPACPRPDLLLAFDEAVLPEDLAAAVQSHLQSCKTCQTLRGDLQTISAAPDDRELSRIEARIFEVNERRKKSSWGFAGAIAASLLVAVGIWQMARETSSPAGQPGIEQAVNPAPPVFKLSLVKPPLQLPLTDAVVFRGQDRTSREAYLEELGKALVPYRDDQFSDAAARLKELSERYPAAPEPVFYGGVSLLMAGDIPAARDALLEAQRIENDVLRDEIAWYLAIAYERAELWNSAKPLLENLCRGDGVHKQDACAASETK